MPQPLRKYKDLNLSMIVNPNTGDLMYIKDEEAIKRSVKNIVLTNLYERHFDDSFGCQATGLLFENISFFTAVSLQSAISSALAYFEPRINLMSVAVSPDEDNNGYSATITFQIKNTLNPISVDMFLERVR